MHSVLKRKCTIVNPKMHIYLKSYEMSDRRSDRQADKQAGKAEVKRFSELLRNINDEIFKIK